ncbi:MAG: hypothetical protein IJQ25_10745, partial [Oscillibacter sp.]|nr:hypothetical protein [Oscillibacter sp.]
YVGAGIAAVSDALTNAGTALNQAATGKDYDTAIRAARWESYTKPTLSAPQSNPYQANAEALANAAHMTDAEQVRALRLSGNSERGAYINSLDLPSRRRAAEAETRKKTAAAFEANVDKAFARESPEGRLIAANVTGDASYAVGKVQNVGGWNRRTAAETLSGRKSEYDYLTDAQRKTIEQYAKAGDFEAVAEYYKALRPDLDAKAAAESEQKNEAFGKSHPFLSMGTQLASGMAGALPSTLETVAGNLRNVATGEYRDIDPNAPAYALTAASSAQARGAEEAIQNPLLSVLRGGAVSAAQNLLLMWLGGGPAAGQQAANTVLGGMALSSAGQSSYEALKEGKSAGNALTNALVSAAIETGTEQLGMERWFKVLNEFDPKFIGRSFRQMARQLPSQMIVEGMEEVLGNELEQTWDMLSEGDRSEYANRIRTLQESGLSRADAASEAALELHVLRDAKAFAEAAFSVLLMDGVPASVSAFRENRTFAAVGKDIRANGGERETIQKGLLFDPDTPARQTAEELSRRNGAIPNREIGRLSFLNAEALYDVIRTIEARGNGDALAKLYDAATRPGVDTYDKVPLDDLRELVKYARENVVTPFEEWRKLHPEAVPSSEAAAQDALSALLGDAPEAVDKNPLSGENTRPPETGNHAVMPAPEAAPTRQTEEYPKMSMEDFVNQESPIWNQVDYEDEETKNIITRRVHQEMVDAGQVVEVPEETRNQVSGYYPDLR